MIEGNPNQQRLLRITAGNLRQSHLYVNGHFDFFPPDAVGSSKRNGNGHAPIEIDLDGLNESLHTDIGSNAKSGNPIAFLRGRFSA